MTEWQRKNKEHINQYNREWRAKRMALGLAVHRPFNIKITQKYFCLEVTCQECDFFIELGAKGAHKHQAVRLAVYKHVRQTNHKVLLKRVTKTLYEKKLQRQKSG